MKIRTCELRGEFVLDQAGKRESSPWPYRFVVMFRIYVSHRPQYLMRPCVSSIRATLAYVHRTRPTPSSCRPPIFPPALPGQPDHLGSREWILNSRFLITIRLIYITSPKTYCTTIADRGEPKPLWFRNIVLDNRDRVVRILSPPHDRLHVLRLLLRHGCPDEHPLPVMPPTPR